jgi:hypothetical protein
MPIKGEYVGRMPEEHGNYVVFDLHTDGQWIAKLFADKEGAPKILCGRDNSIHSPDEYERPNFRWLRITPLTRAEIERYLEVPA